ncbi:MAG TPA: hypothetical protein VNU24_06365 [Solirubrobacteraceae bacterium]|nr:hypothetical protein [Solirubrobacteraceae bacterium]
MRRMLGFGGLLTLGVVLIASLAGAKIDPSIAAGARARASAAVAASERRAPTSGDFFQPVLGMPATEVVVLGSSQNGQPGEVWAYGKLGDVPASVDGQSYADQWVLLEHTELAGWQVVPLPAGPNGQPLAAGNNLPRQLDALAGRVTPAGGVVLLTEGGTAIRDPDGRAQVAPEPQQSVLGSGESLPPQSAPGGVPTAYAADEEELSQGGEIPSDTGLLIAPYNDGVETSSLGPGVLHYDGSKWTRERIEGPSVGDAHFTPEAIACGGPAESAGAGSTQSCWLLAAYASEAKSAALNHLSLFRRVPSGEAPGFIWKQDEPSGRGLLGRGHPLEPTAQMLTVTAQGVWVDYQAKLGSAATPTSVSELVEQGPEPNVPEASSKRSPAGAAGSAGEAPAKQLTKQLTSGTAANGAHAPGGQPSTSAAASASSASGYPSTSAAASASSAPGQPSTSAAASSGEAPEEPPVSTGGDWCFPTSAEAGCSRSLGGPLPPSYQSFAWPGSAPEDPGTRIVTPLETGAMLELSPSTDGEFLHTPGSGAAIPGPSGSAFSSPQSGWIGQGSETDSVDSEGQAQLVEVGTAEPQDQLHEMPVPFGHPLLAVAQAPGTTPGDPGAEAIAVGVEGEIGHYIPGQGWRPETLYEGSDEPPTLRAVAWPEPGRAYAVGDEGTMWLWRAETGLWEPDPATPYNFVGNLTGIAFSSSEPNLGYAVGKQGVLLRYGKTWTQEPTCAPGVPEPCLPAELTQANFTSVAFAGGEALASYRILLRTPQGEATAESGGLAVEDGSGWHVDPSAAALLSQLPSPVDDVLSKVAGLPDGGAVAAGPGLVIERDSAEGPWHFSSQPLPEAQNIAALAAYRDSSGAVRAVVSIDLDGGHRPSGTNETAYSEDALPPAAPGQPPPHAGPDPLPDSGYVLKETASGWLDMEHMALGTPPIVGGVEPHDLPARPDPVLALLVDPSGSSGLAVGGQTDNPGRNPARGDPFQTAAAMRFGAQEPAVTDAQSSIATSPGVATFAVGGGAACGYLCADAADEELGPDVLLTHALQSARQIGSSSPGGLRGFLYTGERLSAESFKLSSEDFQRELARYSELLGAAAPLPVLVAASPSDVESGEGLAPFIRELGGHGPEGTHAYYDFLSEGAAGSVMVIVLDYSRGALGSEQQMWLEERLNEARTQLHVPAIVMGNAALGFTLPNQTSEGPSPVEAADTASVSQILVQDGASAYIFDYPGVNVQTKIGSSNIPEFGSGALGYSAPPSSATSDSLVSSGYLLLEVNVAEHKANSNVAPVSARVEPNIGELALDATNGVLLHRSQVGLFEALARLPDSGRAANGAGGRTFRGPKPYEPIPFDCEGPNCADAIATDYKFTSSNPDIGNFVAHDPTSTNPRQVELGPNKLPVPDSSSGIFCAFNAGTTTVSITAGGLSYSEPVTVLGGSVLYPCGTVPLKEPPPAPVKEQTGFPVVEPPGVNPGPTSPRIQIAAPAAPIPLLPGPHPLHVHHPAHESFPFVPIPAPLVGVLPALVPPPAPTPARPTPPSGTAQVYQSAVAPDPEREEEAAGEFASSQFVAYHPEESFRPGPWTILLVIFAAGAGSRIARGSRRRGGSRPAFVSASASVRRRKR